jgi:puromycin-sensitive aminopeptidase
MASKKEFERLPGDVIPRKYRLSYDSIDLVGFKFHGTVEIDVEVVNETSEVKMNALELWLMAASFAQDGGDKVEAKSVEIHFEKQEATLKFGTPLKPGPATIEVEFTGELNDKLAGFYRSTYTLDGKKRVMATTQFEATDARRAFPCWDEPACKATFEVCLTIPADRIAISNMPCIHTNTIERNGEKMKVCRYAETPIMSTYLLAMVVGEFDQVSEYTKEGVLTTVYTPVGKSEQGRFALKVACEALSFFQSYFGVEYPLRKSDLLAIPDFAAGAMENWGCVTYREAALLIDEKNSSAAMKQRVAMVVCHELAHQWFGNLVTMEWWTHLWLNEGFATFMQYVAVDHIFPEWDVWTEFCTSVQSSAMRLDALSSSHPIEVEVGHPDEVDEIFDAISYQKGASLIRMVDTFVGRENMKRGLKVYLTRHAYSNALTEDLWAAIGEVSGKDVASLMAGWTSQMGYPVLHLDGSNASQTRFLALKPSEGSDEAKEEASKKWSVPLIGTTFDGVKAAGSLDLVMTGATQDLGCSGTFKLNMNQAGFYRVRYTEAQWDALKPVIGSLGARDRIGLISDAFALAKAGDMKVSQAMSLAMEYKEDDDYAVWQEISSNVAGLSSLYASQSWFPAFQTWVRTLYTSIAAKLGWDAVEGEKHTQTLFRSTVFNMLGSVGADPIVAAEAQRRFAAFIVAPESSDLAPDLRQLCYKLSIDNEDVAEATKAFNQVEALMLSTELSEEKRRCMGALGRSRHAALIDRALNMALDKTKVRSQDMYVPFSSVGSNRHGRDRAWAFFQAELPNIKKLGGLMLMGYIVTFVTSGFASNESAEEVQGFFDANPLPSAARKIQQSLEGIRCKAERVAREAVDVEAHLRSL